MFYEQATPEAGITTPTIEGYERHIARLARMLDLCERLGDEANVDWMRDALERSELVLRALRRRQLDCPDKG